MAIKQSSVQFSKLFINSWINSFGVTVSAVAGIGNKLNTISNLISNSLNTAGASMVGQNIGAGKYKRVPKIIPMGFCRNLFHVPAFKCYHVFLSGADFSALYG